MIINVVVTETVHYSTSYEVAEDFDVDDDQALEALWTQETDTDQYVTDVTSREINAYRA